MYKVYKNMVDYQRNSRVLVRRNTYCHDLMRSYLSKSTLRWTKIKCGVCGSTPVQVSVPQVHCGTLNLHCVYSISASVYFIIDHGVHRADNKSPRKRLFIPQGSAKTPKKGELL